ncbi:MAG: NADH-quinone oxidoreductase subunit NuoG [Candidatus Hydrogenedentes bacterium]|nr:NADH-quinone oxidoreductase subunit NuoG [Candidatus Hydrogenedentota bacterium]
MATIYIDDKPYEVKDGQNLLQACLSLGLNLSYFCWHPALGSVGACRQCAVKQFKDENDKQGRLVMSCMTPASANIRISIGDAEAKEFRQDVIEHLMTNHPHDCPVCDEGGECHLQDMTVMSGHHDREYRFKKRTHINQDLGPFINHEMNRCIQCYRCVRYYRDYAGGRDFNVFASHDNVYFGRHEPGTLESEFSGNLVEVCPTGVFTDKTQKKHYTRRWDLQVAPSICVHCGLGCNTTPGERYGQLRRIRNRYNGEVNGYFLCDRGRYGYEFVNSAQRVKQVVYRRRDDAGVETVEKAVKGDVLRYLARLLADGATAIGIGSPRASVETNFALRALVGPENYFTGMTALETRLVSSMIEILKTGPARTPSLDEIGDADAVLVLGEDVTNVAPMMALRLRQSVRNEPMAVAHKIGIPDWNDAAVRGAVQTKKGPLFIATPAATKLDEIATSTYNAAPDNLARLGYAVANAIDPEAPTGDRVSAEVRQLAETIATALKGAKKPLVIAGASCANECIIQAAANIVWALCKTEHAAALSFTAPECNSVGAALLGGRSLDEAIQTVRDGRADVVIIAENDLYRRAKRADVDALFEHAKHVVVIDHSPTATTAKAEVTLPAAAFPEGDGTFVNNEGRAQRFIQVYVPEGDVQESWRWLRALRVATGKADVAEWATLDLALASVEEAVPALSGVRNCAPPPAFRALGQKVPRQAHRYSGRTAMRANINVSEPKIQEDPDSPLTFSMEGYRGELPASLLPSFWAPGWNSAQALTRFQEEIGGPLRGGDPGVRLIEPAAGSAPAYFGDAPKVFAVRKNDRLAVSLYHIFGSEELSALSPPLAERIPALYAALSPSDAEALEVANGDTVELRLNGAAWRAPVSVRPDLPRGTVGVPAGLAAAEFLSAPAWISVEKVSAT